MGHPLELPRYNVRSDMGIRAPERAVPRRDELDGLEETDIPDGTGVADTRSVDHVGVQAVEGSGDDKGDREQGLSGIMYVM